MYMFVERDESNKIQMCSNEKELQLTEKRITKCWHYIYKNVKKKKSFQTAQQQYTLWFSVFQLSLYRLTAKYIYIRKYSIHDHVGYSWISRPVLRAAFVPVRRLNVKQVERENKAPPSCFTGPTKWPSVLPHLVRLTRLPTQTRLPSAAGIVVNLFSCEHRPVWRVWFPLRRVKFRRFRGGKDTGKNAR